MDVEWELTSHQTAHLVAIQWADTKSRPPTADDLNSWKRGREQVAGSTPPAERRTVVGIGYLAARLTGGRPRVSEHVIAPTAPASN